MNTNTNRGTIIDVRTREEFSTGNVPGSYNIPLSELPQKVEEVRAMRPPLVLVCASGGRSGQAYQYLTAQGIKCVNGGSWLSVAPARA
jgi:rhodanese-related sulfurtransferase